MSEEILSALAREVITGDHDSFVVLCDLLEERDELERQKSLRGEDDLRCLQTILPLAGIAWNGSGDDITFDDTSIRPHVSVTRSLWRWSGSLKPGWKGGGWTSRYVRLRAGKELGELFYEGSWLRWYANGRETSGPCFVLDLRENAEGWEAQFEFSAEDIGDLNPKTLRKLDQTPVNLREFARVRELVELALEERGRLVETLNALENGLGRILL